jgi:hypothetical protein
MENKTLVVNRGKFEVKIESLEDATRITYQIPKQEDGINPNDYTYLITHIMQLCMKPQEGKYNIFVDGVQTQTIAEKPQENQQLDTE